VKRLRCLADRAWRTLATGFCFSVFFVGGLLQTLCVLPVLYLLPGTPDSRAKRVRRLVKISFAGFVRLMEVCGLIRVRLHSRELLERSAGCLVIANHPTLIDVVILYAALPRANCVVKGELWRNRYVQGVLRAAGFISNNSGPELLDGCRQALGRGEAVLIFPEGSRSVPGQALNFKRGMAHVAVRTHAPVLTAFITCAPLTLTKGNRWYQIPPQRAHIDIEFRDVLVPEKLVTRYEDKPAAARQLTCYLQDYFEKGLHTYG